MVRNIFLPSALLVAISLTLGSCSPGEPVGAGLGPPDPADVATVELSPGEVVLAPGQRKKLDVTLRNNQGEPLPGDSVSWSTDDAAVAEVGSDGEVVAVAYGETSIRAERGNGKGRVKVRVQEAAVASVAVTPGSGTLTVGEYLQLSATSLDGTGITVGADVAWSSTAPAVATVDDTGRVHGLAPGGVMIVASTGAVADTASLTVNQAPVARVDVTPASATLVEGQQTQLSAAVVTTAGDSLDGAATWSSQSPGTATVSSSGMVTAVKAGTARIVAAAGGKADTAQVTVNAPPPSSISVSPGTASIVAGSTVQLTAQVTDAQGDPVPGAPTSWSSTASGVATVSASGVVSGIAAGSATIRVTSGSLTAQATVTVTPVPVASVSVSPASASLAVGATHQLTATARAADGSVLQGRSVTWSSANTTVATVSSAGLVTARAQGSAAITATIEGKTSTASVTVQPPPVASVTVTPSAPSLETGGTLQLQVTMKDAQGNVLSGRSVSWSSSQVTTATVGGSGLVTATGPGSATITATSEGKSGTSTVTVTDPPAPVASVSLSPTSKSLSVGATQQFSVTLRAADGSVLTGRPVTWQSANGSVATVNASGLVTGEGEGTVTVTAVSEGKSGSASVTVTAGSGGGTHAGWYVSPWGSSGGAGTAASPWDLKSALGGGKPIAPGDTVWVRGGTYRPGEVVSWLQGTSSQPIVVRAYPGERATLDGNLVVFGRDVVLWGLEVMSSNPVGNGRQGLNVKAPRAKLVNLVVHDAGEQGIGIWVEAPDAEVYGSLVYNNGTHQNLDHGIYAQNSTGTRRIRDNVIFHNLTYGFHGYTSTAGYLANFELEGNVAFNNGTIGDWGQAPDLFMGASGANVTNLTVRRNYTYRRNDGEVTARFGYAYGTTNQGLTLQDNYFVGPVEVLKWSGVSQSGNTEVSSASPPTSGTKVVVRPNLYEAGRANVVVYNWGRAGSVPVDVSGVLQPGDRYEVRHVFDFFGTPVASGTYSGGSVTVPMTAKAPPTPIGRSTRTAPTPGPTFGVFVVLRTN